MKRRSIIGIILILAILAAICYVSINQMLPRSDEIDKNNITLIVPGKSHFGAEETYLSSNFGKVEAGKNIAFELRIEKNQEAIRNETIIPSRVKGKYSDVELPLPSGMTISCTPSAFTSYPGKVYNVSTILTTTNEVPEDTYFFRIQRYFDSGIETLWISVHVAVPTQST
ncbi:MAG: hypothetical protein WC593_01940 [Methanoregula sp.]